MLLLAALLPLALLALLLLQSSSGRDWLLGARLRWTSLTDSGNSKAVTPLLRQALTRALDRAGIDPALARVEERPDSTAGGRVLRWEQPLPAGCPPARAQAVLSQVVTRFGGHAPDSLEADGGLPLARASLPPGIRVEFLLMGKTLRREGVPRLALLVDRFGYRTLEESQALLDLGVDLTAAIVPYATGARDLADQCRAHGIEVVADLPMEGLDYPRIDPGPGAVLVDLSPGEIGNRVHDAFDKLGGASGAHTFMGDLAVEDQDVMKSVLEAVARERGYFVDSTPTIYSVTREAATRAGVPALRLRDNIDAPSASASAIRRNLEDLADRARRRGTGVGLIHPYPGTVEALKQLLPLWQKAGLEIVPLSEVLGTPEE